jgi:hypothetical protein
MSFGVVVWLLSPINAGVSLERWFQNEGTVAQVMTIMLLCGGSVPSAVADVVYSKVTEAEESWSAIFLDIFIMNN